MFAVIKTGGKQSRVAAGDTITVEKLTGEPGETIAFEQVLMLVDGTTTEVGAPSVAGVTVAGELVEQTRGAKVIAFKKRRRKNSRRKRGHRQDLTVVKITDILTGGAKPALRAKASAPACAASGSRSQGRGDIASGWKAEKAPKPKVKKAEGEVKPSAASPSDRAVACRHCGRRGCRGRRSQGEGIDTGRFQHLEKPIGHADDLKLISGVGPAIEKKLNASGIWHYWQVKAMSDQDIASVDSRAASRAARIATTGPDRQSI